VSAAIETSGDAPGAAAGVDDGKDDDCTSELELALELKLALELELVLESSRGLAGVLYRGVKPSPPAPVPYGSAGPTGSANRGTAGSAADAAADEADDEVGIDEPNALCWDGAVPCLCGVVAVLPGAGAR